MLALQSEKKKENVDEIIAERWETLRKMERGRTTCRIKGRGGMRKGDLEEEWDDKFRRNKNSKER